MKDIPDIDFVHEDGSVAELIPAEKVERNVCECVELNESLNDNGFHIDVRKACKVHNHMPMYGKENTYGQNWFPELFLCPRCVDAVPVGFRVRAKRIEAYCRKCDKLGHKDGSQLFWVKDTDLKRIIDG